MDDFVVDTKGHCFLCLRTIPNPSNPFKLKLDENLTSIPSSSRPLTYSLVYFSRYLKMDMGKVFCTNGPISPELLAKVESAKLKAELCEGCGFKTERLSQLYRQLERIEIEMAFYVKDIQEKLLAAETDQLRTPIDTGKLEIVKALRSEAAKKCSDKLPDRMAPQVKVQNHTQRQLNHKRLKIKYRCRTSNPIHNKGQYPSTSGNLVDSPLPKAEADIDFESWNSPSNSMANEDIEDDPRQDVTHHLDNPSLTSSSALDFDPKPGIIAPTKPQSTVNPKTGKHKCKLCSKEFSQYWNFKTHYMAVHLKVRYKCSLCSKMFTYQRNHRRHLLSEHKMN